MKRGWLLGIGAMLSFVMLDQTRGFGGHGHAGTKHVAKEKHEAPKHSGGKPAPHAAPKPPSKPPAKPQSKPAAKPQLKKLPKPEVKPKENNSHNHEPGKSATSQHKSNDSRPGVLASGSKNQQQTAKDGKTHHDSHHDGHHEWHHDRVWHGHHQYWSEEGSWVDGTPGQPVAGDGTVPAAAVDGVATGSTLGAAVVGRPQIHFNVDSTERDAYDAAAQAAGMSRAEWIRSRLNAALHGDQK